MPVYGQHSIQLNIAVTERYATKTNGKMLQLNKLRVVCCCCCVLSMIVCGQLSDWVLSVLRLRHHQFHFLMSFFANNFCCRNSCTLCTVYEERIISCVRFRSRSFFFSSKTCIDSCASFSPLFRVRSLFSCSESDGSFD